MRTRARAKKREAKRVVGVSVSEWETESRRAAEREIVREGYCTAITSNSKFAIGQSLNGLKLFPSFICIYLQAESVPGPFRILGEVHTTFRCKTSLYASVSAMKANI